MKIVIVIGLFITIWLALILHTANQITADQKRDNDRDKKMKQLKIDFENEKKQHEESQKEFTEKWDKVNHK